jgi:hypothetical protein
MYVQISSNSTNADQIYCLSLELQNKIDDLPAAASLQLDPRPNYRDILFASRVFWHIFGKPNFSRRFLAQHFFYGFMAKFRLNEFGATWKVIFVSWACKFSFYALL